MSFSVGKSGTSRLMANWNASAATSATTMNATIRRLCTDIS
jgi:hypothetical protein